MKCCNIDVLLKIIIVLIIALLFTAGIYESVIVNNSKQYSDGCGVVHTQIIVCAIVDIVSGVVLFESLVTSFQNTMYRDSNLITLSIGLEIFTGLWAVVSFHRMGDECYDFWQSHAPELLTFVKIHYAVFWTIVGLTLIGSIGACVHNYIIGNKKKIGSSQGI